MPAAAAAALKRQSAVYGVEINMFEYDKVAGKQGSREAGKQGCRQVQENVVGGINAHDFFISLFD